MQAKQSINVFHLKNTFKTTLSKKSIKLVTALSKHLKSE
jgi:hypothetical protein